MTKEHLQQLEWARQEVNARVNELEERHRMQEIGGIEHKILLHERLLGRDKHEFIAHIDGQIADTKTQMRDSREIKIAVALTLFAMMLAFASTFIVQDGYASFAPETPTGFATEEILQENMITDCWNNTPPDGSHTTPTECQPVDEDK